MCGPRRWATTRPSTRTIPRSSYGASSVDIKHRFVLSGLFGLPTTTHFGAFGRQVLNGWRVNDVTYVQSGGPFTITTADDENFDGSTGDRPNIIGDPYSHATTRAGKIHSLLNPAAFANTNYLLGTASFYGSEQRNQLRLPFTTATNVSLFKEFTLPHETRLQIRAESFNVIGNVNFTTPRTDFTTITSAVNIANPAFAELQAAQDPRQFQFGARFLF